jgi:hypothetical protein
MATVVNNDGTAATGSGISNIILAVVILAFLAVLLLWGLPMLRGQSPTFSIPGTVNVNTK